MIRFVNLLLCILVVVATSLLLAIGVSYFFGLSLYSVISVVALSFVIGFFVGLSRRVRKLMNLYYSTLNFILSKLNDGSVDDVKSFLSKILDSK